MPAHTPQPSPVTTWQLRLPSALSASQRERLNTVLDEDERNRSGRILNLATQDSFVAAHALLRAALSSVDQRSPASWRFDRHGNAKPTIRSEPDGGLAFSLSHTVGMAACAVTRGGAVGIDIEAIRPVGRLDAFARILSHDELARLNDSNGDDRDAAFWTIWTAKEAIAKADGRGLAMGLNAFTVTDHAGELYVTSDGPPLPWKLRRLNCGSHCVGAFAIAESNAIGESLTLDIVDLCDRLRSD